MNWRMKLADWLTFGALTRAREWSEYEAENARKNDRRADEWREMAARQAVVADSLHATLLAIAAEEKPTSNATVRRMARIAREALQ